MSRTMACIVSLLCANTAFAQSSGAPELWKNLSAKPIEFDSSYDLEPGRVTTLFSKANHIYARLDCNQNPSSGFQAYMKAHVDTRLGTHVGYAYMYFNSYAECRQLELELFDNPAGYQFRFGSPNYLNQRDMRITKLPPPTPVPNTNSSQVPTQP